MKILAVTLLSIGLCAVIAGICLEAINGAGYIIVSLGLVGIAGIAVGNTLLTRIFIESHNQTSQNPKSVG